MRYMDYGFVKDCGRMGKVQKINSKLTFFPKGIG